METLSARRTVTLSEFGALPVGPPYVEFEEGEIVAVPSPTPEHQDVMVEITHAARRFVRQGQGGRIFMEVDVYLPDGRVYVPDMTYLAPEHLALLGPADNKIHGVPDLVVEIRSSNTGRDRVHKFQVYFQNGITWYWLIDPQSLLIEEYCATPTGYELTQRVERGAVFTPGVFPGLLLDLEKLLST